MKSKWIACLMVAMLLVTAPAAAKNKGTQTILNNWGSVTVPQNIYMEAGTQPTLAAQEADNDMAAYIAEVLPANTPRTYQIVKMDQGVFQYAYMLHYTLSAAEVRSLIGTDGMSVTAANDALRQRLPRGFYLVDALTEHRSNGTVFYTGAVERNLFINGNGFIERMYILAWQHGTYTEAALIIGRNEGSDDLLPDVLNMLMQAKVSKR